MNKYIVFLLIFLAGGLIGRSTKSVPTKVEYRDIEKIVYKENRDIVIVKEKEKMPDGTVIEREIITDRTIIDNKEERERNEKKQYARTLFFGGIGTSVQDFSNINYTVGAIRDNVIGDFGIGGSVTHSTKENDTTVNLIISYGF